MTEALENVFKSRKQFRNFIAEDGKEMLEEIIGFNMHFQSITEESTDENPDIEALIDRAGTVEKTVIECELKQNIKTLANLLKHANNYQAENLLWLVNQETQEAINTASWINNRSEIKIHIIKCCFENYEIKFKPLLKPSANTYQKPRAKITDTKQKQNEFWQSFSEYLIEKNLPIKITPAPQHWQYLTIGISGVSIQLTINTAKNNLGCELLIANDKELFKKLETTKTQIEKQLGKLDWQALEGKKSSRIRTTLGFDISDKENPETGFLWLFDNANRFKAVFSEYLNKCVLMFQLFSK